MKTKKISKRLRTKYMQEPLVTYYMIPQVS